MKNTEQENKPIRIHRTKKKQDFTQIENSTIADFNIKESKEFYLLVRLLSLPETWEIHPEHLAKAFGCSYRTFHRQMSSLIKKGYVVRRINRHTIKTKGVMKNVIRDYEYDVYEEPIAIDENHNSLDDKTVQVQNCHASNMYLRSNIYISPPEKRDYKSHFPEGESKRDSRDTEKDKPKKQKADSLRDNELSSSSRGGEKKKEAFKLTEDVRDLKNPMSHLTNKQKGKANAIVKDSLQRMHKAYPNVRYNSRPMITYVAKALLGCHSENEITACYKEALKESDSDARAAGKTWSVGSTTAAAFEKLYGKSTILISDRRDTNMKNDLDDLNS